MKEKFLYLFNKMKEMLGFGDPIVTVSMDDAKKLDEFAKAYVNGEEIPVEEQKEGAVSEEIGKSGVEFVSPTQMAENAMQKTKNTNTE